MSDYFGDKTDLSNESTVVMNTDEIDAKLRLMREEAIQGKSNAETDFVIPPDFMDMTVVEEPTELESTAQQEEFFAPQPDEQILPPIAEDRDDAEEYDEDFNTPAEHAKHKKKVRNLVICAIVAIVLIGVLAIVLIAKDAKSDTEYISNMEIAQTYYNDGEYDKALSALRQAMSIKKTDECLLLMADCYEAKNDYVNALAILESSNTGSAEIKDRIEGLKIAQKAFEDGNKVVIGGEEYSVDITSLDLADKGLRSKDLNELQKLTELTTLKLGKNKIDKLNFLVPLKNLVSLDLSENNIKDVDMLVSLSSLKTLHLDGNKIENFEPLCSLKNLTTLTITGMKISESQLKQLEEALPNCSISSDEAEKDVVEIEIGGKKFKSDVKEIDLSNRNISDISDLNKCTELEILNLAGNSVSDISTLLDLPKLKSLSLENNNISDIRPLMSLTTLEYLNLSGNKISSIAALSELTALEELSLKGNSINDFSPISNLVLLDMLDLTKTGITDSSLQYLYKLKDLQRLALDDNSISMKGYNSLKAQLPNCNISHSDFGKITLGKKSFAPDAVTVDASGQGIKDISAAAGFACVEKMNLSKNSISDLTPLYGLDTLKELDVSGNNLSEAQISELMSALPACRITY